MVKSVSWWMALPGCAKSVYFYRKLTSLALTDEKASLLCLVLCQLEQQWWPGHMFLTIPQAKYLIHKARLLKFLETVKEGKFPWINTVQFWFSSHLIMFHCSKDSHKAELKFKMWRNIFCLWEELQNILAAFVVSSASWHCFGQSLHTLDKQSISDHTRASEFLVILWQNSN